MNAAPASTPWFLWPFAALWDFITGLLKLVGRVVLALLALLLMMVGVLVALTVLGAPVGIPLAALGFLLLIRAVF